MNAAPGMAREQPSSHERTLMSETEKKLVIAASHIQRALFESVGLREREGKLVVYWTLATHALQHLNTFPVLVLLGKMGTGKSQTLKIIHNFAFRSVRMSLRGMTGPAIRDKFASCYEGTAIVEEADAAWKDSDSNFERLISDRYQRDTAEASLKERSGDKNWRIVTKEYFGATVLHRRMHFVDPALDGRSVIVRSRPDHTRQYREFDEHDPWNVEGKEVIREVTFELPDIKKTDGVAARVFNSYKPLLGVAKVCGDSDFEQQTVARLLLQGTLELKEAQASEPDGLVLRAIVEVVFQSGAPQFDNIRFGGLSDVIWKNHHLTLTPRQIGPIVRELGFETRASHGVTVVVPTAASLLRACDECDYSDEAIEELRKQVLCSLKNQGNP
jgi:hypothetical protein